MKSPVVHFEIPADDVERAIDFYKKIFGWEFNKYDMPATGSTGGQPYYGVITTPLDENQKPTEPGAINGGLMKRANSNHVFTNYIYCDDIDHVLETINSNGGQVCMPKTEIAPGMGWIAMFRDTEGNMMGLHQMPQEKEET